MVDESGSADDALLLVHQRVTAITQAIVIDILAEAELVCRAHRGNGIAFDMGVGGLQPVFDPVAIVSKIDVQRAVVQLQRLEIAVGDGDHLLARRTLAFRHVSQHQRARRGVAFDAREGAEFHLAADDRLDLGDGIGSAGHAHAHDRRMAIFLDHAEPADLPGGDVGAFEIVTGAAGRDGVPQTVTDLHLHVVFGEDHTIG